MSFAVVRRVALTLAVASLLGLPAGAVAGAENAEQRCGDRGLTGQAFDECVAEETAAQQQEPVEPAPEEVRRAQDGGSGSDGGQTLNQTQSGDGIQQDEQQSDPSGSIAQNAVIDGRRQERRARGSRSCEDLTRRQAQRRPRCASRTRKEPETIATPVNASQIGVGVTLSVVS